MLLWLGVKNIGEIDPRRPGRTPIIICQRLKVSLL